MTHLSALMIITLNLTITQSKSLAKYLMTLVNKTGAPNENIVQNHLKIALLNVF